MTRLSKLRLLVPSLLIAPSIAGLSTVEGKPPKQPNISHISHPYAHARETQARQGKKEKRMDDTTLTVEPLESAANDTAAQALEAAENDVKDAQALVTQLLERAKSGEKVTAQELAAARAEVDLAEMIRDGRRLRIAEIEEEGRQERVEALAAGLADLAADTSREVAEKKMRAAIRSYVEAATAYDHRQMELFHLAGSTALAPLPDNISVDGSKVVFNNIVLRNTRFQTAISQAAAAAISEFHPRLPMRLDTPID